MRIRARLLALVAGLLVAVTGGLVATTAAPAAASFDQCTSGQACLFGGDLGQGSMAALPFSQYNDGACHTTTFHPIGGFHSAVGGYGSGYKLSIWSGSSCNGTFLGALVPHAWWSSGGSGLTVNSFKITS
jgi:hypothetical protein